MRTTSNSSASGCNGSRSGEQFFLPATWTPSLGKAKPRSFSFNPSKRANGRARSWRPMYHHYKRLVDDSAVERTLMRGSPRTTTTRGKRLGPSHRRRSVIWSTAPTSKAADASASTGRPIDKFDAYFRKAMWIESTRGSQGALHLLDVPKSRCPTPTTRDPFEDENALILTRHLGMVLTGPFWAFILTGTTCDKWQGVRHPSRHPLSIAPQEQTKNSAMFIVSAQTRANRLNTCRGCEHFVESTQSCGPPGH